MVSGASASCSAWLSFTGCPATVTWPPQASSVLASPMTAATNCSAT